MNFLYLGGVVIFLENLNDFLEITEEVDLKCLIKGGNSDKIKSISKPIQIIDKENNSPKESLVPDYVKDYIADNIKNNDGGEWKCRMCSYQTNNKFNLNNHIE